MQLHPSYLSFFSLYCYMYFYKPSIYIKVMPTNQCYSSLAGTVLNYLHRIYCSLHGLCNSENKLGSAFYCLDNYYSSMIPAQSTYTVHTLCMYMAFVLQTYAFHNPRVMWLDWLDLCSCWICALLTKVLGTLSVCSLHLEPLDPFVSLCGFNSGVKRLTKLWIGIIM